MVFLALESSKYERGGERPVTDDDEKRLQGEQRSRGGGARGSWTGIQIRA